ncbi:MAG TPA: sulfatase, partial [Kofleriaceae bacterium]|nr:sulfatase [Kofleriaceae bacterium]
MARRQLVVLAVLVIGAGACSKKKRQPGDSAASRESRVVVETAASSAAAPSTTMAPKVSAAAPANPASAPAAGQATGPAGPRNDAQAGAPSGVAARAAVASSSAPEVAKRPARSEHAVFRLVDNRHAAHRYSEGDLVLDGADVGFARYTRFSMPAPRWQLGQEVEGERAAVADRLATLEVPLSAEQARGITFVTARVHGSNNQRLTLKVNGRRPGKDASVELVAGWITVAIPVARGYFAAGENQLVLETSGGKSDVAVAWMRFGRSIGSRDPRADAVFDPAAETVALARNAAVRWYVTVPDGAHFVAAVNAPCKVELRARASDDSFAGGLLAEDATRVDLGAMAGRVVALTLTARDCPKATLRAPQITVHGPAPVALPAAEPPRYVVLWVMDALRADKIPIFTPGARAQTPNLDELAKTSAVFRQYYVQGNESQTSHSSMWTGLYPAVHGVRLAGVGGVWRIGAQFDVLAQEMARARFTTLAVTGNGYVNEDGGYARGFREFRNMMRETGVENGIIYGQQIVDAALDKLDHHRTDPAYLFLGTIDTHGPWIARKPWIDVYSPGPYRGPFQEYGTAKDLGFKAGSMGCSKIPPPADIERLRAIYDSAVSYHDVQVGRLVKQLQSWGIWDQTMLIITADHGEELFEDQRCGHGGSLRDTLTRVPLLIHDPARFPSDTIVDEGAEGVDLMPTVLSALGVALPDGPQGAALEPLAQGVGRGWARPSYASQYEYAHAMRIGRWKARVGARAMPLIGDMAADPGEKVDAGPTHPIERRMLTDNLGMFLALRTKWRKSEWGVVTSVTPAGALALDR